MHTVWLGVDFISMLGDLYLSGMATVLSCFGLSSVISMQTDRGSTENKNQPHLS